MTIVEVPAIKVPPPVHTVPVPVKVTVCELMDKEPAVKVTDVVDQLSCSVHAPPEPLKITFPKLFEAPVIVCPVEVEEKVSVPVYDDRMLELSVRFPYTFNALLPVIFPVKPVVVKLEQFAVAVMVMEPPPLLESKKTALADVGTGAPPWPPDV